MLENNSRRITVLDKVTCVIVTYNRLDLFKECIAAVLKQTYKVKDIIVVDNCSTDGTTEYIKKMQLSNSNIHYYQLIKNIGGAGGFNYGIKQSNQFGNDLIWIMDDDTVPSDTALEQLVTAGNAINTEWGFLCSNIRWLDNSPCLMNIPQPHELWNDRVELSLTRVKSASFVSILIPLKVVNTVGLPISDFFIWGDDLEYTLRISQYYPCFFVQSSIVCHKMKNNLLVNIHKETGERISRYYFHYRNTLYTQRKLGRKHFIVALFTDFYAMFKVLLSKESFKIKKTTVILRGIIAGMFFSPLIEKINEDNNQLN